MYLGQFASDLSKLGLKILVRVFYYEVKRKFDNKCSVLNRTFLFFWTPGILVVCIWHYQKHDYANYDQFASNFDSTKKTIQLVSVPNFKLFGPMKIELWSKEGG